MRKILLSAAVIFILTSVTSYSQSKFGLGLILGEPTGVSGKYYIDKKNAVDGAFAWSSLKGGGLHIHGDYLYHFDDVFSKEVPLYVGVGGRVKFSGSNNDDNAKFGLRVPVGFSWFPPNTPIDLFVEVAPLLDIAPSTELTINAAAGIRYYFH